MKNFALFIGLWFLGVPATVLAILYFLGFGFGS